MGSIVVLAATHSTKSSWSIVDDWNELSSENPHNAMDGGDFFPRTPNEWWAEQQQQQQQQQSTASQQELSQPTDRPKNSRGDKEDGWLKSALDSIQTSSVSTDAEDGWDGSLLVAEMDSEIARLIRCNEVPQELLIQNGRALPPLTEEELYHVGQLVQPLSSALSNPEFQPTLFFQKAIATVFAEHAKQEQPTQAQDETVDDRSFMDRASVAAWLQKSLKGKGSTATPQRIGPHDRRVLSILSQYGTYGSARLTLDGFQRLYMDALVGSEPQDQRKNKHHHTHQHQHHHAQTDAVIGAAPSSPQDVAALQKLSRVRHDAIRAVWRDLSNHGIVSPVQLERTILEAELKQKQQSSSTQEEMETSRLPSSSIPGGRNIDLMLFDECEIVDDDAVAWKASSSKQHDKMSHELVELADDGETPLWIKDGEFGTYISRCQ